MTSDDAVAYLRRNHGRSFWCISVTTDALIHYIDRLIAEREAALDDCARLRAMNAFDRRTDNLKVAQLEHTNGVLNRELDTYRPATARHGGL